MWMDVFEVHERLISDYDAFTSSLVQVRDERVARHLAAERADKVRWPDPWLSLNPNFETGGTITELARDGLLHPGCERLFRIKTDPDDTGSRPLTLHRHQREAIGAARTGRSYVLTTGTGSGKSLTSIVPIVDGVLRNPEPGKIKAIVVYPMNALANSQLHERSPRRRRRTAPQKRKGCAHSTTRSAGRRSSRTSRTARTSVSSAWPRKYPRRSR